MVLSRNGQVELLVREDTPVGKADSLAKVKAAGGTVHLSSEIASAAFEGEHIAVQLSIGRRLLVSLAIVQIGFLSAKDTLERLAVRLNPDGSITIDTSKAAGAASSRSAIFTATSS